MAIYTDIEGQGKLTTANITGASTITITAPATLNGSAYLVLEAVREVDGTYNTSSPNLEGTFSNLDNVSSLQQHTHLFGIVLNDNNGGSFDFTPDSTITAGTAYVRGTGGITVDIS